MRLPALLLLLLPLCVSAEASAQAARLYPVDEAVQQPDFFSFRAQLLRAAQVRDTAYLYSTLAPDILNSFGGDGGVAEFRRKWRPEEPTSEVWTVLTDVLALGGSFYSDTLFIAPYTSSRFPAEFDGFEYLAIVGANVRARQRPGASSPVLTTLSFDVVRRADASYGAEDADWTAIQLADGRTAFVARSYVRSPIGYRAGFVRRDGRWLLRTLVAGD
jgi:hypothetical protein